MLNESEFSRQLTKLYDRTSLIKSIDYYCFRNVPSQFSNQYDIQVPIGSVLGGGRYNRHGGMGLLYLSKEPTTCMEETTRFSENCNHDYERAIRKCIKCFPLIFAVFEIKLHKVLDLTDPDVLNHLNITIATLTEPDWLSDQAAGGEAQTQVIGRLVREAKFEAILSPSARCSDGKNFNIFCENLLSESKVELLSEIIESTKPLNDYIGTKTNLLESTAILELPLSVAQKKSLFALIESK